MANAVIGAVSVAIGGDTSGLNRALDDADKSLSDFESRAELAAKAGALIGTMAVATGAAIAAMTTQALGNAEATLHMAQAAGMAVRTFSELEYAARLNNISADAMGNAMSRLNRNVSEAAQGQGDAKDAFDALGIKVTDATGKLRAADVVLEDVATRFATFEDGPEKSALAIAIFGRAGAAMIPMLNEGSQGLAKMREEAHQLGVVLDTETAKAADEFNDNMERVLALQRGVANGLMKELLPALTAIGQMLAEDAKQAGAFGDVVQGASKAVLVVFQTIAVVGSEVAFVLKMVGGEIGVIAAQLKILAEATPANLVKLFAEDLINGTSNAKQAILDLGKVPLMSEEWKADAAKARTELDAWQERIMNLKTLSEGGVKPPMTVDEWMEPGGRTSAPRMPGKEKPKGKTDEEKEAERQQKAFLAAEVARAEEILRTQNDARNAQLEMERKAFEALQEMKTTAFSTEAEQEVLRYDRQLEIMRTAMANKLLTQEEFDSMAEQLAAQHQGRLSTIEQRGWTEREKFAAKSMDQQARQVFGELEDITSGVAQHNKVLFNMNKVAGIANAILNAHAGISKTLSTYPYPWNIAMAAAHGMAAFAQVRAISSTQFGSGSATAPALAGSTAAPPVSPVGGAGGGQGNGQTTIISLRGDEVYSPGAIRKLVASLNAANRDGSQIRIDD